MRNDGQICNLIVGLLFEFKQIINSKDKKHLILDHLSKRVDNYKKLFTNMKDKNIINLTEPFKITHKESNKRKKSIYEQNTRFPKNKIVHIKPKKVKSCGFCNTTNHTANKCPTTSNIGQIIDGDVIVELLQDTCPFKVIESDQYANIFCESLDFTKNQHLKCHQLLSKNSMYEHKT